MSTRLQVVMDEGELVRFREAASQRRITLSEWVRQALREAARRTPEEDVGTRLLLLEAAAAHEFPTADIDVMLEETAAGYGPLPEP